MVGMIWAGRAATQGLHVLMLLPVGRRLVRTTVRFSKASLALGSTW